MGLFSPKLAPRKAAPAARKPAAKTTAKKSSTVVHAAKKPTAAEKKRHEDHKKGRRLWAEAEALERAGDPRNNVKVFLLKGAAMEATERSQRN